MSAGLESGEWKPVTVDVGDNVKIDLRRLNMGHFTALKTFTCIFSVVKVLIVEFYRSERNQRTSVLSCISKVSLFLASL